MFHFKKPNLLKAALPLLLFMTSALWAQQKPAPFQSKAINKIAAMKDDTLKVKAYMVYIDTALSLWRKHPETMFNMIMAEKDLSEKLNYNKGILYSYRALRGYYTRRTDYLQGIEYGKKYLEETKKTGTKAQQANALDALADTYGAMQDQKSAINYRKQALALYQQTNDQLMVGYEYSYLSVAYSDQKDYKTALDYDRKSLEVAEKLNHTNLKAAAYCELAWDNYCIKNYFVAYQYCQLFLKLDNVHEEGTKSATLGTLGEIYRDAPDAELLKMGIKPSERTTKALACFTEQLKIARAESRLYDLTYALHDISGIYAAQKNYEKAYDAYKEHIKYRDSINNDDKRNAVIQQQFHEDYTKKADSIKYQQQLSAVKAKQQNSYLLGGIAILLLVIFFIFRNSTIQRKLNRLIMVEKQRSDDLLTNILPADVAEELKEKGSANAKLFDEVTVLFTDFVNFTTISELLSPQELVDELHHCFKAFDDIMATYNIEKIKTIGDAYLAVAGLPNADVNHAVNAIKAARDIQQFIHHRKAQLGDKTFDIRIGIHSGSVVAGIVGVKKFAYDIWGDTVNTTARMEQNSEPGKINVSEKTYELVKDQFQFTYRGEIVAKNKGALKMYFLNDVG